jgi:hypothetical protein
LTKERNQKCVNVHWMLERESTIVIEDERKTKRSDTKSEKSEYEPMRKHNLDDAYNCINSSMHVYRCITHLFYSRLTSSIGATLLLTSLDAPGAT